MSLQAATLIHQRLNGRFGRVGLIGDVTPIAIAWMLGASRAGIPFVPLDSSLSPRRLSACVADADIHLLLSSGNSPGVDQTIAVTERDIRASDTHPARTLQPPGTAEGVPLVHLRNHRHARGVRVSVRNLQNYLTWAQSYYGVTSDWTSCVALPLHVDASVTAVWLPIRAGGSRASFPCPTCLYGCVGRNGPRSC